MEPIIIWFRHDLRVEDHAALSEAASRGQPIIPLFLWAPHEEGLWPIGAASRWWLHYSLKSLQDELAALNLKLIIREGDTLKNLKSLLKETGAKTIFWHRRYEPHAIKQEARIQAALDTQKVEIKSFKGNVLFEPWELATKQNKPFQVFTPFWKACLSKDKPDPPLKKIGESQGIQGLPSLSLSDLKLLPKIHWDEGIKSTWTPGSSHGKKMLQSFVKNNISTYPMTRDRPELLHGVSHLSPYLHFGEVTPAMIWQAIGQNDSTENEGANSFWRQIGWREFAHHLLYHFPHTPEKPLKPHFNNFPWNQAKAPLIAWQKGMTGYPFVDAGMRQLWATGWMHNRVRMIVGSFLVKDLQIPWQEGEKWFWETLVDADLANNCLGWQWIAGCGADAAPYFRIFNPITQGERFDSNATYVRTWVPELKHLPDVWIHKPWQAPENILQLAGVTLGTTYPYPLVDHAAAREAALVAFKKIIS